MRKGLAASTFAAALALAFSMPPVRDWTVLSAAASTAAGGRQSTCTDRAPAVVEPGLEGFQAYVDDREFLLEEVLDGHDSPGL